jgi:GNAT superfamily N-acetyltransferase
LPYSVYPEGSLYVPQLEHELKKEFSPEKNPFFKHARAKYFTARIDGAPAGRVAAIVNDLHNEYHGEKTGFFGFFECVNSQDAASLLLSKVAEELKAEGMHTMRGPTSFSTNEECGLLIEGFDKPPMLMTPYNPPYYADLIEGFGLRKVKDLYAYIYKVGESLPEKMLRAASFAERRGVAVRPIRKVNFGAEMMAFKEVYNSAWADNWGFVPLTDEEIGFKGKLLKSIVVPELTLIAEAGGETVGFLGLLPDMNRVLSRMRGKLNPVTILKALYYSRKVRDLRLLLLGIKPSHRTRGVDALLYREAFKAARNLGYRRVEFSWILEDNEAMIRVIELLDCALYKKFRIYEKSLV